MSNISRCRSSCLYIYAYFFFSIRFLLPLIPFKSTLLVSAKMSTISEIKTLVKAITTLSNSLPQSVQQGTKEDKIWSVMNTEERETAHETFNWRFDAMFGEDSRHAFGCLQYVCKGRLGLGRVCSYLSKIDWADNFPLDIVEIKLSTLPCPGHSTQIRAESGRIGRNGRNLVGISCQWKPTQIWPGLGFIPTKFPPHS